jgi:hypothetical protein
MKTVLFFKSMATMLQIPLEQYLATSYRPDCEYVDGEVRERNVGKYEHARIQALPALWFGNHEQEWAVQVVTAQRVQVPKTRVRIPDVTLLPLGAQPDVINAPPVDHRNPLSRRQLFRHP